ncbi:MAG TPA: benzoate-CoA ligase family protein [Acidimicrobiia bacterium]|nr:benzoate-CoA ligase family protein [Acidimicrobiia bacterium]
MTRERLQTTDNVSTLLDANLEAGRANSTAVITASDERWTFADLHTAMCRVANHLREIGVRREERILLVLDDTPAFPASFLGAMRIGAVPIPVNFLARPDDFGYFLDDSYAVAAIVDAAFLPVVGPYLEKRKGIQRIVANGAQDGYWSLDGWIKDGLSEVDPVGTHQDDPAFWLYSSGSTGLPKAVVHRHADVAATCCHYAWPVLGIGPEDVVFSSTKMFHAYGLGNNLTFPMSVGATSVYLTGRPTPDRLFERVASHRPTLYFSVPALYNAILSHPGFEQTDWSSVRLGISAAEPLPPEIWRRFHERTGIEILDGLGSTEMLHIYCSNRAGKVKPGTSGVPVDGYELEIRGEEGRVITGPEAGELWVRGPSALTAYWHQIERTREKLAGGWFASGDRYHRDQDGYFVYEGRVDDMMKVAGLWVSPIEIENRLMEHPAVREAAVVGVQLDNASRIKAVVILTDDQTATEPLVGELQEWCKQALQRYQYPHVIEFVDDFPRTPTGKIQRFKLRDQVP